MNPLSPKQIRSLIDMWADIHDEKEEEEVVEVETTEESVSEEPLDEVNMGLQTGLANFSKGLYNVGKKVLQTGAQAVGGAAKETEKNRPAIQREVGKAATGAANVVGGAAQTVEKNRPAAQGAVGNAAKAALSAVSGAVGGSPSIQGSIGKAVKNFSDTVAPPPERSNEPTVRSGERTPQTGMSYVASRDKSGERYDKTGTIAPAKLDPGTRGSTMPSNPQFKGVGANTVKKVSYPTASQTQAAATPAPTPAPAPAAAAPTPAPAAAPAPTAPPKIKDYGSKAANMDAWAKANPKLAARLKPRPAPIKPAAASTGGYNPRMKSDIGGNLGRALSGNVSDFKFKEGYDVVLDHLLSEGHADTVEEAHYIMLQMTPEHIQEIVKDA